MAFFEILSDMAKSIGDKTSEAIEITKLNSKIRSEKEAADRELKRIGTFYYERFTQGGEVAPEMLDACQAVKDHYESAVQARAEIDRIKVESEMILAAEDTLPSQVSGQIQDELQDGIQDGILCPVCGSVNSADVKFCRQCGNKVEESTI